MAISVLQFLGFYRTLLSDDFLRSLTNPVCQLWEDQMEGIVDALADFFSRLRDRLGQVLDHSVLKWLATQLGKNEIKLAREFVVVRIRLSPRLGSHLGQPFVELGIQLWLRLRIRGISRPVDGDGVVIGPETMALGIRIGKHACLQDGILRRLDARDQVRRRKRQLLDLGTIVLGETVQGQLPKRPGRERLQVLGVCPQIPMLGWVEDVEADVGRVLGVDDLNAGRPGWVVPVVDCFAKVSGSIIGIQVAWVGHPVAIVEGWSCIRRQKRMDVFEAAIRHHPFVGMVHVATHPSPIEHGPEITELNEHHMQRFMVAGHPVPVHVRVDQVSPRISSLSVHHAGELDGIPDEEQREVQTHPVPISLVCEELGCHSLEIPHHLG